MEVVSRCAEEVFIPLTVGGGVASVDDVDRLLRAGADKVAVNTAAIRRPELVAEIADRFGNQVLVLSVDARRAAPAPTPASRSPPTAAGVRRARRRRVGGPRPRSSARARSCSTRWTPTAPPTASTSTLIAAVRRAVTIPVIASGGAGRLEHFPPAVDAGADAVLAATVFHFGTLRIGEVKQALAAAGHPVRA